MGRVLLHGGTFGDFESPLHSRGVDQCESVLTLGLYHLLSNLSKVKNVLIGF